MSYEIQRTVKGANGCVVLEWADGKLIAWVNQDSAGESGAIEFDRLGVYQLYAEMAVINAAADGYANPPSAIPLEAT